MTSKEIVVVNKKAAELKKYNQNSRTHSAEQVQQIANSISEFGWTAPILIDELNVIIAGHGRFEAAQLIKLEEIPCIVLSGLSEEQKQAYRIADNKLSLNSDWDFDLLKAEIEELKSINIEVLGFNDLELNEILKTEIDNPEEHWIDMPEFVQENKQSFRQLIVHFRNDDDVRKFSELVKQVITDKTKFIWYPEQIKEVLKDKHYVSES